MFNIKDELKDEIRINHKYTHLYFSEYPKTTKEKSIPKINEKMILTSDYLKRVTSGFGGANPVVFPPNCRYFDVTTRGSIVVIEEPPAFRTVSISMSFNSEVDRLKAEGKLKEYGYESDFVKNKAAKRFTLAFPYVIFLLFIDNYNELIMGQSFLRTARLTGLADYLLKIPLLNITESQHICFGSEGHGRQTTLNAAIERAIIAFWGAEFNTDHTCNYITYRNVAGVNSYMEWQALSKSNPMFIYNVDWIQFPMNLGQAIEEAKRQYKLVNKYNIGYHNLSDIFHKPADTGKDEKPSRRSKQKFRLFYDVAEGTFLSDNFCIHVGDSFRIKNDKSLCRINSLISFMDSGDIKYIRVEREDDGRLIIYKNTKKFTNYLLREAKKLRFEEKGLLKNGVEIKEGDIIVMKNALGREMYRKVSYIRKSPEGFHEGRFGDGFYILENTEAELFNLTTPEYNGIILEKGKKYVYITNLQAVPIHPGSIVEYDQVDVGSTGQLTINMLHVGEAKTAPYQLKLNSTIKDRTLFRKEEVKPLPPFFRIGRKILIVRHRNSKSLKDKAFGTPSGIIYDSFSNLDRPKISEIQKYMLGKDKFHVQSFDMDIEFAIGDKVVVSDWKVPSNMLSIKIIQGFKFDKDKGDITFILADKEGKLYQEKYVDGLNGIIYVGKIRKITNKFGKLITGTKIKAKEANIPHFPMKDINIIIGFITDTGGPDPLVLCSNCCTLWYSDVVDKFQKITMKAKKWEQLKHAPIDITKIKFQAGDIIQGKSSSSYVSRMGWLVCKINNSNSLRILDFRYYSSHPDFYLLDRYITANSRLDCIPSPRVGPKAQTEMGFSAAWPNLHGHSFTCERSAFRFINDERSMVNVQSNPE